MRGYGGRVMTLRRAGGLFGGVGRVLWGADPPRPRLAGRWMSPYLGGLLWLVVVAAMYAGAVGQMFGAQHFDLGVAYALGVFQVLPLVSAPWYPLMSWRVSFIGMILGIAGATMAGGGIWPWPATSCICYLAVVLIAVLRHERPAGTALGVLTFLGLTLPAYLIFHQPLIGLVASAAVTVLVVAAGAAVRPSVAGTPPPVRDDAGPRPEGLAAVPVLGPVVSALWIATDRSLGFRPRSRRRRNLSVALALAFGGAMFGGAVGQMYGPTQMGWPLGMAYGLGSLQALPLVAAPWFPLLAWRISSAGLVLGVLTYPGDRLGGAFPWPATGCIAYLLILLLVGLRHDRHVVAGVGLLTLAAGVPLLLYQHVSTASLLLTLVFTLIVLVLGDNIRTRRVAQAGLAEQTELRRQDLARQAVLEERSRIARELHDVVAHHMSMIAIQAEAAPYKIPGLPDEALRTFTAIRGASTTALTEMRRVIGLLRDENAAPERLPQPGLDLLEDLVAGARDAGMTVRTVITGTARPLPAGVDVSAYRIVQEALSNAARHAPGAAVTVSLGYGERELRIRVADDGAVTGDPGAAVSGGHGLVGMRERVTMLGGTFHAGPAEGGGFAVTAELPIGENDGP